MKVIRFDSGFRYDDPNSRWGNPSVQLEPGDPGYVAPQTGQPPRFMNQSSTRKFRCKLSTLLHAADSFKEALEDADYAAAMAERLDDPTATPPFVFLTDFTATIAAVRTEVTHQSGKTGDLGTLSAEQKTALAEMERLTAGARRTARHTFPGEEKLRSEFQVGIEEPNDLASILARAEKTLAAVNKYAAELKKKGWLPRDATALQDALDVLTGAAGTQDEAMADRVQFTADLTRAANALYHDCLTIQNAARLEYPSTQPGTEAARLRFQLETFPPRDRSEPDGGTQPPEPPAGPTSPSA